MTPAALQPVLVSVAMVVFNGERDVARSIDSVLAQTYANFELIVVDDGSTDGTWAILQSYGDRLRAIHQDNGGLPVARNTAVSAARGSLIALMDHDDLCYPERLAAQVAVMAALPHVGLTSSEFSAFDDTGPIAAAYAAQYYSRCDPALGGIRSLYPAHTTLDIGAELSTRHVAPKAVPVYHGEVYATLASGNFVHPPTVMFRRELLARIGLFDPAMGTMCDWEWLVRVSRVTQLAFIDAALLDYRRSPTQMSSTQHRPRGSLDALRVAQHLCEQDPALIDLANTTMRANLADLHASAAYANSEIAPRQALRLLARAMLVYRYRGPLIRPTLIRALLPMTLLDRVRARRMFHANSH
jgi:GT2 family glycosyltransferase